MIDLLVRAACDSGDTAAEQPGNMWGQRRVRPECRMDLREEAGLLPSSSFLPKGPAKALLLVGTPDKSPRHGSALDLASLASSRHRSSFAHRFFCDLVAGTVGAYEEKSCPHHVAVIRDERAPSPRDKPGLPNSAASWRPKHQLTNGWYLVDPPEDHGLCQQSLSKLAECSWSGQSGREKRDDQIKSLLVRDIGVVPSATQTGYAKRAKIYTFDPEGDCSAAEQRFRGVKLLCVHDKRRYTRKTEDSPPSAKQELSGPPKLLKRPGLSLPMAPSSVESELGKMLTKLAYPREEQQRDQLSGGASWDHWEHKRQKTSPQVLGRPPLLHLAAVTAVETRQYPAQANSALCL